MKKIISLLSIFFITFTLLACNEANMVSRNISQEADSFKILRRIVFYNGITGDYILVVEGYCSIGNEDPKDKLSITCKTNNESYKKHFLGLSDNVTFFSEQIDGAKVSSNHYKVIFKPSAIVPDIEIR